MYLSLEVEALWADLAQEFKLTLQDDCRLESNLFTLQPIAKYFTISGDMEGPYHRYWIKVVILNSKQTTDSMNLKWYRPIQYKFSSHLKTQDFSNILISEKMISDNSLENFKFSELGFEIFSSLSISNHEDMRTLIRFILNQVNDHY